MPPQARPVAFRETFAERLCASAKAHSILTSSRGAGVSPRDLVTAGALVRGAAGQQYSVSSPEDTPRPQPAVAVHVTVHGLATNVVTGDALSTPGGRVRVRVRVRWAMDSRDAAREDARDRWASPPPVAQIYSRSP